MRRLSKSDRERVFDALDRLQNDLTGDVKRLTNFTPEYRLRVGNYRLVFEIEDRSRVVIYHVRHRRDAYRG
jgi:mRNA interferase RelE/StbE